MPTTTLLVNRAPVLTLWAAVVAERLGFDHDESLTLGKAVAGLNAQAKGQSLGIFHPSKDKPADTRKRRTDETFLIELVGRPVPATNTDSGIRATIKGQAITPESVTRYLEGKFRENLADVRSAMQALASAFEPQELEAKAYSLYAKFRPDIPAGKRGWGAEGTLDLDHIRSLGPRSGAAPG